MRFTAMLADEYVLTHFIPLWCEILISHQRGNGVASFAHLPPG